MIDEKLIADAMSIAGAEIHDVAGACHLYRNNLRNAEYQELKGLDEICYARFLANKYERILRSFLVTKDIHKSKLIIEDSLKSLEN